MRLCCAMLGACGAVLVIFMTFRTAVHAAHVAVVGHAERFHARQKIGAAVFLLTRHRTTDFACVRQENRPLRAVTCTDVRLGLSLLHQDALLEELPLRGQPVAEVHQPGLPGFLKL